MATTMGSTSRSGDGRDAEQTPTTTSTDNDVTVSGDADDDRYGGLNAATTRSRAVTLATALANGHNNREEPNDRVQRRPWTIASSVADNRHTTPDDAC